MEELQAIRDAHRNTLKEYERHRNNKERKIEDRIKQRFLRRIKGSVKIKLKDGDRLLIQYMYGGMYAIGKQNCTTKKVRTISIFVNSADLAKIIHREQQPPLLRKLLK